MASSNNNPFVMPGMGQSNPDIAGNPLMASMEMMRQAWSSLAGAGGLAQSMPATPALNIEELDRRIAELKSVESWLTMNLSMLGSAIQGMEVQRSTINTLRSFVDAVSQFPTEASTGQSPLEAVLGIRRPPAPNASASASSPRAADTSASSPFGSRPREAGASESNTSTAGNAGQGGFSFGTPDDVLRAAKGPADKTETSQASPAAKEEAPQAPPAGKGPADVFAGAGAAQSASQAWFDMLQQQFATMAQATAAASMSDSGKGGVNATAPGTAAASTSPTKSATKAPSKPATKAGAKSATKRAPGAARKSAVSAASKGVAKSASKAAPASASKAASKVSPKHASATQGTTPATARKRSAKAGTGATARRPATAVAATKPSGGRKPAARTKTP